MSAPTPTPPGTSAAPAPAGVTIRQKVHFRTGAHGRKRLRGGAKPAPPKVQPGRVPRVARMLALAIHYDELIHNGLVRDHADLARLGNVSRARISQIMDLLNLAPQIQERILCLPLNTDGRDSITERQLRFVLSTADWMEQDRHWLEITERFGSC